MRILTFTPSPSPNILSAPGFLLEQRANCRAPLPPQRLTVWAYFPFMNSPLCRVWRSGRPAWINKPSPLGGRGRRAALWQDMRGNTRRQHQEHSHFPISSVCRTPHYRNLKSTFWWIHFFSTCLCFPEWLPRMPFCGPKSRGLNSLSQLWLHVQVTEQQIELWKSDALLSLQVWPMSPTHSPSRSL